MLYINTYGCEKYNANNYISASDDDAVADPLHTKAGSWPSWVCTDPTPRPIISPLFFGLFVLISAFVLLSLFIGIITSAMLDAVQRQREEQRENLRQENMVAARVELRNAETNQDLRVRNPHVPTWLHVRLIPGRLRHCTCFFV